MVRPTLPSRHPNPARSSRVRLSGRSSSTLPKWASSVRVASATAASMRSATGAPARACWPRCATASCCRAVARSVASVRDNCASRGSSSGRNSRKRGVLIEGTTTLHSLGVFSTVGSTARQCAPSRAGAKRRSGDSPNFPRTPRNRAGTVEHVIVLKDLATIFAVSLVVILAFHRLKLPALPGFIVAGVLLGPNALGLVSDVHRVEGLAEVGVILLLFTIGIEFSLNRLREMGRQVLVGGGLQVGLTVVAAGAVAAALGLAWQVALFLGCLIALSSTALVLKGLTDNGEIDAPHGRLATGVLIFQDLCVVPIMLALPFLAGRASGGPAQLALALGKAALIVVGVTILARTLVPRLLAEILKTRSRELFLIAIILLGTLTALGTAEAGASLALGAFLAGLVISESDYSHQALAELLPFRDVFISLFFVAVGMLVQFDFIREHPVLTVGGAAVVLVGKTLVAGAGPALLGYAGRVALLAGLIVSQIGEFSFVLAREGRGMALLSETLYQTFLAIAVVTMLVTPFLLQSGPTLVQGLERLVALDRLLPGLRPSGIAVAEQQLTDHVIVAGYGLNGRNLSAALRAIEAPYCIVELNAQTVRQARSRGEPAFYGDATREEILRALGLERARMLVAASRGASARAGAFRRWLSAASAFPPTQPWWGGAWRKPACEPEPGRWSCRSSAARPISPLPTLSSSSPQAMFSWWSASPSSSKPPSSSRSAAEVASDVATGGRPAPERAPCVLHHDFLGVVHSGSRFGVSSWPDVGPNKRRITREIGHYLASARSLRRVKRC